MRQFLFVLCITALGLVAHIAPASAQFGFFDNFFDGGPRRPPPRYDPYEEQDRWQQRYERRRAPRVRAPRKEVSSSTLKPVEVSKDANAKKILVIGDDMATGLTDGLHDAFAKDSDAKIEAATVENASLIGKNEGGEIAKTLKDKITALNPSAIVLLVGTHDIGSINGGGESFAFQSEGWRRAYQKNLDTIIAATHGHAAPVYWVGLPPSANKKTTSDIAFLNDIYREKAMSIGAKFIDVWEGFVDENSQYMVVGPDVNGNQRRLRLRDGFTMTPAGNRKLAFYVETKLRRDLAVTPENAQDTTIGSVAPSSNSSDPAVINGFVGPVISLTTVVVKDNKLLGEKQDDVTGTIPVADIKPGRADDFSWPPDARTKIAPAKDMPAIKTTKPVERKNAR